jgi:hypothetical protein
MYLVYKVICQIKVRWREYWNYAGRITDILNMFWSVPKTKLYIHIVSQFTVNPVYTILYKIVVIDFEFSPKTGEYSSKCRIPGQMQHIHKTCTQLNIKLHYLPCLTDKISRNECSVPKVLARIRIVN